MAAAMKPLVTSKSISFIAKSFWYNSNRNNSYIALTRTSDENGVRRIVLDNPKKRNALSLDMIKSLKADLSRDINNKDLRCIILSGSGPVFSAGHDLSEFTSLSSKDSHEAIFKECCDLMLIMQQLPIPVIAQVNGLAAAAGCQLVASCDIVIATDRSRFSTPGASVGLFCSTPGIAVSRAVPRKVASYMLLTGTPIDAQEALRSGLVSKVVPENELALETDKIVKAILSKSRSVIELGKQFYIKQLQLNIEDAYRDGTGVMVNNIAMSDAQEGIEAFLKKRHPNWNHSWDKVL